MHSERQSPCLIDVILPKRFYEPILAIQAIKLLNRPTLTLPSVYNLKYKIFSLPNRPNFKPQVRHFVSQTSDFSLFKLISWVRFCKECLIYLQNNKDCRQRFYDLNNGHLNSNPKTTRTPKTDFDNYLSDYNYSLSPLPLISRSFFILFIVLYYYTLVSYNYL
jgi:hypothetical protein